MKTSVAVVLQALSNAADTPKTKMGDGQLLALLERHQSASGPWRERDRSGLALGVKLSSAGYTLAIAANCPDPFGVPRFRRSLSAALELLQVLARRSHPSDAMAAALSHRASPAGLTGPGFEVARANRRSLMFVQGGSITLRCGKPACVGAEEQGKLRTHASDAFDTLCERRFLVRSARVQIGSIWSSPAERRCLLRLEPRPRFNFASRLTDHELMCARRILGAGRQ